MTSEDFFNKFFTETFNEIKTHYYNDEWEKVNAKARELLKNAAVPVCDRIKTLVTLSSTTVDRKEASVCCAKALKLWNVVRKYHREGDDETGRMTSLKKKIPNTLTCLNALRMVKSSMRVLGIVKP